MAFPYIWTADTSVGHVTSNSDPWTLTWPTGLVSGDLILCFVATDGSSTPTWPAGWVQGSGFGTGANTLGWAKYKSDGTETGTFSLTLSASEQGSWALYRISQWGGTLGTTFTGGGPVYEVEASSSFPTGANSTTPDPPSLNPTNWDVEDTLWFAVMSCDTSRTVSVYPLADNNYSDPSGGAGGATLGVCTTNSAVASLDPGTFTISASDDWLTNTLAVRPGTSGAAAPSVGYQPRSGAVNFVDPGVL